MLQLKINTVYPFSCLLSRFLADIVGIVARELNFDRQWIFVLAAMQFSQPRLVKNNAKGQIWNGLELKKNIEKTKPANHRRQACYIEATGRIMFNSDKEIVGCAEIPTT